MGVGNMAVGKMGQIIGETEVGEIGVGKIGVFHTDNLFLYNVV